MEIGYRLDEADLHDVQAQLVALRRADLAASVKPFLVAIAGAAALGWPLWAVLAPGRPLLLGLRAFLVALAAAAAVAALLAPGIARFRSASLDRWAVRRLARASARRSVLGPVTVAISPDGVVRRNEKGELRLGRAEIRDVLASPRLLTVRPRGLGPVILIPARAFPGAETFDAARARLEALAGAPAVAIDLESGTVARPGGARPRRRLRPELAVALALAVSAAGVHALAARAYDPRRANPPGSVVVYTTASCGVCAVLRGCLERSGVPFDERDVERSARAEAEWAELGGHGVPVTLVGADVVHGLELAGLAAALGRAGHRLECAPPGAAAGP
jgi:glutaredoxin